ncbi:MAG: hypothetical protein KDC65_04660 [Saprospiraceae bacterium]|nr:hypothetical protein [Saprospiraceae bacterium]
MSDDLTLMYPGTYPADYYRRLHRLVHKRFRLQQALEEWRKLWRREKSNILKAAKLEYYAPAALIDAWRLKRLERPRHLQTGTNYSK